MSTTSPENSTRELALLRGLRQHRQFLPDPVPTASVDAILEVGRWTGSGKNVQPWHLLVVEDADMREALSNAGAYASFLASSPLVIVIGLDGYAARQEAYDAGRLSERIMLAASSLGLGSGTGWFGPEDAQAKVRHMLGMPANWKVWSAIGIGYPLPDAPRSSGVQAGRKPVTDIASFGKFGQPRS